MSSVKIQSLVTKQVPEFIREDYPVFVDFLKAYYTYLETVDARDIEELRDLDKTIHDYIIYFNNELAFLNNIDKAQINPLLFLRKSKQIFLSKASEDSYKFIFRILFNKNVEISYPWDSVLKSSDGKWQQDTSIFVHVKAGDVNSLSGNDVYVYGTNTKLKIFVDRVVHIRDDIYELFINKNFYGVININDRVSYDGFSATVIPTTVSYTIENPGSGYKPGDLIYGSTIANFVTINQLLKVTKVNAKGGVVKVETLKFGAGYTSDFYLIDTGAETNNLAGTNFSVLPQYQESGFISVPNVWAVGYSSSSYAGVTLSEFNSVTANGLGVNTTAASFKFKIGAVARYQGYYSTNDGFLDDSVVLQDSKYYQKYSYKLTADETLASYRDYIKSFVHSAGLMLFSEYQIQNTFNPQIGVVMEMNV